MKSSDSRNALPAWWKWSLGALVLAIAAARAVPLFSNPLVPGMNGGYYLVQARCVLTQGTPGVPDFPLTFYLQAALAALCRLGTGGALDPAVILGVKLADAFFPALLALPVALLALVWCRRAGAPAWIALAAGAAAGLNSPILRMVGDFQKNSLGLVWLAALLYALHLWIEKPSFRRGAAVALFGGLAGLTHIGVFGAALLFGGLSLLLYAVARRRAAARAVGPLAAVAVCVGLLAAMLVVWKFDPQRIGKLSAALTHPVGYLTGGGMGGGPGGGGPGGMRFGPWLCFGAAALAGLVAAWRGRLEGCIPTACALGVLVLTGPWVHGDKAERFQLLAMTPGILAAAFAIIAVPHFWVRNGLALGLTLLMTGSGLARLGGGGGALVTGESLRELESMAPLIAHPEKTLIAARHGMEWWTAWALHTHIAHPGAVRSADWRKFEAVYFLQTRNGGMQGPPPGGGPGGPPEPWGGGGPGGRPPGAGPEGMAGPGRPPGGGGHGGPGGGHMEDPEIPAEAQTVHEGENFTLVRVSVPPDFVCEAGEK